jgi:peptide/nickel transport system permease protein
MITYIIRRLMILPVVMFIVTLILFSLIMQLPLEQRARVYLPSTNMATMMDPEKRANLIESTIEKYGLDEPAPVQYVNWMRNLVTGEWGYSPTWQQPVLEGLLQRVPATAELAFVAMIPSVILALSLGSLAARYRHGWPDHAVRAAAFVAWAFPSFILGLMMMNVFYAWLGWFPPARLSRGVSIFVRSETFQTYTGMYILDGLLNGTPMVSLDAARHLVLPAVALAGAQWALLTRIMRSSMMDALSQDYVTTARAKGVPEPGVVNVHARPNAVLPLISTAGVSIALLLSGVVVIEAIFSLNGIGHSAAEAIRFSDIPVAVGFAIFSCGVTVLASLIADFLYAVVDPRVRL